MRARLARRTDGRDRRRAGVRVDEDGRITAVDAGVDPAARRDRLRGLTLPGLANAHSHAFHRALRGRTQDGGGTSGPGASSCTRSPPGSTPDTLPRAGPRRLRRDGAGRHHLRRRVPLPAPRARRRPVRRPERDGRGADRRPPPTPASASPCWTPATWPAASTDGHLPRTTSSAASPTATPTPGPRGSPLLDGATGLADRRGDPLRAGRARGPAAGRRALGADRGRPLHVHLSEQPAENDACRGALRPHPDAAARRHGVLGPRTTAVHATHLTDEDIALLGGTGTASACAPPPNATSPTASARPPAARRGRPLSLGSDSHAVIDLFEEARAWRLRRAAAHRHARPLDGRPSCSRRDRRRPRRLGWPDAGRSSRARPPTSRGPAGHLRTAARRPAQARAGRDGGRRAHGGRRRARRGRPSGRARARRRRRGCSRTAIEPLWEDAMSAALVTGIASWSPTTRPAATARSACSRDAALVIEGGRVAWVGPARRRPRRRRRASTPAAGPCSRASWTPTRTWSSPATGPPSSTPGCPAALHGGGIRTTVAATRAAPTRSCAAGSRRSRARRAPGHHHLETKSGYGLTVEDEARALRSPREHTDEITYLGAHVVPPEYADDPALRRPGHRRDARRLRPARPLDRRLLRAGGPLRRRPGPRGAHRRPGRRAGPARARQPARPPAPACSSPSSSAPPAPTTAPTSPTPTSTPCAGGDDGRHPAARRRVLHPPPYPDARRLLDAGRRPSRWPPTATPAPPSPPRCRSASPWPSARWA